MSSLEFPGFEFRVTAGQRAIARGLGNRAHAGSKNPRHETRNYLLIPNSFRALSKKL